MPQFFAPLYWWLFLLLIPLVIVYFLKLRRTRVSIPSLALWQQVVNDQRVNSPFQRFKKNLLLLLQMLVLCLLVLAAMQPFFTGVENESRKLPILIDCSASMGAVDTAGMSRLDLVKAEVGKIIESLPQGNEITLIEVGAATRRVTDFTDNRVVLQEALENLRVSDVPSKLDDGLRLAQALTRSVDKIESVRLYTDGNLPTKINPATGQPMASIDFDLSFPVDFFQIDPAGGNLGITSLNARRSTTERWDVFVRVESSVAGGGEGTVRLFSNGKLIGEEAVKLVAEESQRLVFGVDTKTIQRLQAKIDVEGHDALAADNSAWLTLPVGRQLKVYCPLELTTYRHALAAIKEVSVEPDADGNTQSASYDLLISNDLADGNLEATTQLFVGAVPTELTSMLEISDAPTSVVDWQREAALLQHVQLKDVLINDLPMKREGVDDSEIERLGYQILAYGNQGPLILRKQTSRSLAYYLLFQTDRSTLPYRVGFPIIISNLINESLQSASLSDLQSPSTGVLPPIQLASSRETTCRVTAPSGEHDERTSTPEGLLLGIAAPSVGEYEVRADGVLVDQLGVALLSPSETSLATVSKIFFNEVSVEAAEERKATSQLGWRQLAMAALCILLIEWWYFQRRPTGLPD